MPKSRDTTANALERSPSHLLHRVLQLALDLYAEEAGPAAISQRQYAVLCAVQADEGVSQTGLVRATGIDRSTLADMVSRMIGKGLLVRERSSADARANIVRTTEAGREALADAAPKVAAADRRVLELLGAKKRDAFVSGLRRLARAGEAPLTPEDELNAAEALSAEKARKKDRKKKKKTKVLAPAAAAAAEDAA
ncbi:MAG: MarR family winged helix-turn-helix transcriptional regulator [Caulobacteraceae bacterium]